MGVFDSPLERLGKRGDPKSVRRDGAERTVLEQLSYHRARPENALARIGSVENFVEKKERRRARPLTGQIQNSLQPPKLRVEVRNAVGERVNDPHARRNTKGSDAHRAGTYRPPSPRPNRIDSHRAQQRTLARHVRAGDNKRPPRRRQTNIIAYAPIRTNQRLSTEAGIEQRLPHEHAPGAGPVFESK